MSHTEENNDDDSSGALQHHHIATDTYVNVMDARAAKLALARQKLKNHQEKKFVSSLKDETSEEYNRGNVQQTQVAVKTDNFIPEPQIIENITEEFNEYHLPKTTDSLHTLKESDVNVTEILISSKRNLELHVNELQLKLSQLENNYTIAINNNSYCKQQISKLESELQILHDQYRKASEAICTKEKIIADLNQAQSTIRDENNNLQDQLEFTKSMLTTKESENASLQNELVNLQNQIDTLQLQLQQITNGNQGISSQQIQHDNPEHNTDVLLQKIANLEQQLKTKQKERDQIDCHYEQYVAELNKQLKLTLTKNNELLLNVQNLTMRENSLIEQISEMEIRIQNMRRQQQPLDSHQVACQDVQAKHDSKMKILQEKYHNLLGQFQEVNKKYEEIYNKFVESEARIQYLSQAKETDCEHDNISLAKLTSDIASDKLAAQMATEQNKKMKLDLQELEGAFVKISRDKLDLIEKISAEKYLNRELTIRLAEIEEKAKDLQNKLRAKDDEMIRLQNSYRSLEQKLEDRFEHKETAHEESLIENGKHLTIYDQEKSSLDTDDVKIECRNHQMLDCECVDDKIVNEDNSKIPREDAMVKLQDRFLKIMNEVADLSDEKHRLEHIILQLQNETDTICEYVALYQEQRSLLNKRDEERSAQIKIFQIECQLLKNQLEELSGIIIRLAQDTELAVYFQSEPRHSDIANVMNLLKKLRSNILIDPNKTRSELKNFYPCSCCSGQLIEV